MIESFLKDELGLNVQVTAQPQEAGLSKRKRPVSKSPACHYIFPRLLRYFPHFFSLSSFLWDKLWRAALVLPTREDAELTLEKNPERLW